MKDKFLRIAVLAALTVAFLIPLEAHAQQANVLTLEDAKQIMEAAEERAHQDNWTVAIAIVDQGGHLLAFRKIDGTQIGSIEFAIDKAKSAVYFKRSTKVFEDAVDGGNHRIMTLPGAAVFEGGIPVERNGEVIGAIGVSGVTAQQDGIIAQAGLDALSQ